MSEFDAVSAPDDAEARRKLGVLARVFSQCPKNLGRVPGKRKKKTISELPGDVPLEQDREGLMSFLSKKKDFIPPELYRLGPSVFHTLLAPRAERPMLRGGIEVQPVLFGADVFLKLINQILSHKTPTELNLSLGISVDASDVSPCLPAYVELGIQRLEELLQIGVDARLRLFSMGSLTPEVNGVDRDHVSYVQGRQKTLIDKYLNVFHQDMADRVQTDDILMEVPSLDEVELSEGLERIMERVPASVIEALSAFGRRYSENPDVRNSLTYGLYHTIPSTFGDGGPNPCNVSIGGPGEYPFNVLRWALLRENPSQMNVGIVVNGVGPRTPPYLDRDRGIRKMGLSWDEVRGIEPSLLLRGGPPSVGKDFRHIARCNNIAMLKTVPTVEGIGAYQDFLKSLTL